MCLDLNADDYVSLFDEQPTDDNFITFDNNGNDILIRNCFVDLSDCRHLRDSPQEFSLRNPPETDCQLKTSDVPEDLDPFFSSQVNKAMDSLVTEPVNLEPPLPDPILNNPLIVCRNISREFIILMNLLLS